MKANELKDKSIEQLNCSYFARQSGKRQNGQNCDSIG